MAPCVFTRLATGLNPYVAISKVKPREYRATPATACFALNAAYQHLRLTD
jgi:hypothetical protein